jgi:hypothetical protein
MATCACTDAVGEPARFRNRTLIPLVIELSQVGGIDLVVPLVIREHTIVARRLLIALSLVLLLGPIAIASASVSAGQSDDLDCEDFQTQEEAQAVLDADPSDPNNLDPNGDGIACGLLPTAVDLEQPADANQSADQQAGDNQNQRRANRQNNRQNNRNQQSQNAETSTVTCANYATAEEAQAAFDKDPQGFAALDADGDGIACEELIAAGTNASNNRDNRRQARQNQSTEPTNTAVDQPSGPLPKEDLDCIDFQYQEDAQAIYNLDPSDPFNLDPNKDGFACSSLPSRTQRVIQVPSTGAGSPPTLTASALVVASLFAAAGAGVARRARRRPWMGSRQ